MAVINHAKREINAKLVYYGPPGSGKGALLKYIHQRIKPSLCGPLKTMDAGADSLLFFDYAPFERSCLNGYRIRFHLYTLTGPVSHPGTWKMTLKGVDGVALVTGDDHESAGEALQILKTMLSGYGKRLEEVPRFWLSGIDGHQQAGGLTDCFDAEHRGCYEVATGAGVLPSLARLSQDVLQRLRDEFETVPETACLQPAHPATVDDVHCPDQRVVKPGANGDICVSLSGSNTMQVPLVIGEGSGARRYSLTLTISLQELEAAVPNALESPAGETAPVAGSDGSGRPTDSACDVLQQEPQTADKEWRAG
jgi:hypothetical protein